MNRSHNQTEQKSIQEVFQDAVDDYKDLLKSTLHPENQTDAYRKQVTNALLNLKAVMEKANQETNSEDGTFGIIILLAGALLVAKDENIKLQKYVDDLKLRVSRLEKNPGLSNKKVPQKKLSVLAHE